MSCVFYNIQLRGNYKKYELVFLFFCFFFREHKDNI